jgi:16S rRNA U1498 N3-methylase RsmE
VLAEPGGEHLDGSSTSVLVGPEGGWDPAELAHATALLGLGDNVLRAETAAIVCATLLASVRTGALRAPDGGVG